MGIGFGQLLIILLIVLLVFGGKRLAGTMGDLGSGIRNFKKGLDGQDAEKEESSAPRQELDHKEDASISVTKAEKQTETDTK